MVETWTSIAVLGDAVELDQTKFVPDDKPGNTPATVSAGKRIQSNFHYVDWHNAELIKSGTVKMYIWGYCRYRSVFDSPHDPLRITEYLAKVTHAGMTTPKNGEPPTDIFALSPCGEKNRAT